ncbi:tau 95 subunit of transcription factor TFIIIC [Lobulomyces angularis]|nr:tau 95 subunit of transcription factor TFIIIC [Lobulomyces angularis]
MKNSAEQSDADQNSITRLPQMEFFVVEYPGYVNNIDNVLQTLGGIGEIQKGFLKEELPHINLKFRKNDIFSHPVVGEVVTTTNLVLKTVTRRNKLTGNISSTKHEVVGVATKTARFRHIADYQFIPNQADSMVKLAKSLNEWNIEEIENAKLTSDKGKTRYMKTIPPPLFSRAPWAGYYNFRQSDAVKKVIVKEGDKEPEVKLVKRRHNTKNIISHKFKSGEDVPQAPSQKISDNFLLNQTPQVLEIKDLIYQKFELRPIWTSLALFNNINNISSREIKKVLPNVAYFAATGPWRDSWIKYGFDPRVEKSSISYQVLDVRIKKKVHHKTRGGPRATADFYAPDKKKYSAQSHIFDGLHFEREFGGHYQIADITDSDIKKLIEYKKFASKSFDDKLGWIDRSQYHNLRMLLSRKTKKIINGGISDESEDFKFEDEDVEDEAVVESNSEGENDQGDTQEQEAGDTLMISQKAKVVNFKNMEIDPRINSKVDELMKNLHHASGYGDNMSDDSEDEFDYFDLDE